MDKISVVIPALNEEQTILNVIIELQKSKYISEIIVIDNCSTDNTAVIADQAGAKVISCNTKGYGFAVKEGIKNSSNKLIFKIDADIKNPNYQWIEVLYKNMIENNASLVKTYWDNKEDTMPVTNLVAKPLLKVNYPELEYVYMPLSGIYLFDKSLINLEFMENTFAFDLDLLISIHKIGHQISQVFLGEVYDNLKPISNYTNMSYELISFVNSKKEYDKSILLFLAHPDDAEIWCGGLIAKYALNHNKIYIVLATSTQAREEESLKLKESFPNIEIYFMKNRELSNFYTTQNIEFLHNLIIRITPKIFITHHKDDIHIDHKICFDISSSALLKLDRKQLPEKLLMCNSYFQNNHSVFNPNIYINISDVIDIKLNLINNYKSQDIIFWKEMIKRMDSLNGLKSSVQYAEAYEEYPFYTINRAKETL